MNFLKTFITLIIAFSLGVFAFYEGTSVAVLTDDNFHSIVLESRDVWVVEFYAPWCGHCKKIKEAYIQASGRAPQGVRFGAIDAANFHAYSARYEVKGFPTIKIFYADKGKSPEPYQGNRSADSFISAARTALGLHQAKEGQGNQSQKRTSTNTSSKKNNTVFHVSPEEFDTAVLGASYADNAWIVAFTVDWCGHCQKLAPELIKAAKDAKKLKVRFVKVDLTSKTPATAELSSRYSINGYPTILSFNGNQKAVPYNSARDATSLVSYAQQLDSEFELNKPAKVTYLTPMQWQREGCDLSPGSTETKLCLVAFLPAEYDTNQDIEDYVKTIRQSARKASLGSSVTWFITDTGRHPSLSSSVLIDAYAAPSFVAISPRKKAYAKLLYAFTDENIVQFVQNVVKNRQAARELHNEIIFEKLPDRHQDL